MTSTTVDPTDPATFPAPLNSLHVEIEALKERVRFLETLVAQLIGKTPYPVGSPAAQFPGLPSLAGPLPGTPPAPDPRWRAVHHVQNIPQFSEEQPPPACGGTALYLTRMVRQGEKPDRTLLRVRPPGEVQYREPNPNEIPTCSNCGRIINPYSSTELNYAPHLLSPASPTTMLNPPFIPDQLRQSFQADQLDRGSLRPLSLRRLARRARSAPGAEQGVRLSTDFRAGPTDEPPQASAAPEARGPIQPVDPAELDAALDEAKRLAKSMDWGTMGFPGPGFPGPGFPGPRPATPLPRESDEPGFPE
jgi:hypothetical protein